MMSKVWLSIPLEDYEGHMASPVVRQMEVLADLFKKALAYTRPESVIVLGVAGGNGLEQIDGSVTKRVIGVDINQRYLDEVQQRFSDKIANLQLHCCDLTKPGIGIAPASLVHAALIFEHAGLDPALANAMSVVSEKGFLSVVLQLAAAEDEEVTPTPFESIQRLKRHFQIIEPTDLQIAVERRGFRLVERLFERSAAGRGFWMGIYAAPHSMSGARP